MAAVYIRAFSSIRKPTKPSSLKMEIFVGETGFRLVPFRLALSGSARELPRRSWLASLLKRGLSSALY